MTRLEILARRMERELAEAKSNLAIAQLDYDAVAEEEDHEAMAEFRHEISELAKVVEGLEEELAIAYDNEASERLDNHD